MDGVLLVDKRAGYHVLTLNRPDRLNSFNVALHEALAAALGEIEADDDCRAVLLTGAGRGFCAGQDLSDRVMSVDGPPPDLSDTIGNHYNPLVRRLRALPKPIVCAVNGVAAGAGCNIALACDIVLAARSASFLQAFARIGLIPDSGGTWWLPHFLGEARAKGFALLAEPIGAEKAEQWGLIWKAVDDAALMDEAHAICARLAGGPTLGLGAIKLSIQAAADHTLDEQLELERKTQQRLGFTPDYAEGVRAFLGKRKPNFTGRA